ncbi:AfsR/SARP family transcriptional regulator [Streptomyces sp. WAC 04229]|uniref:AfsR/SARP family transcriptional regulator n=1 Tax=Streptomyces sp. WAC 04229 TaxID=2203206 RepID=UPI003D76323A
MTEFLLLGPVELRRADHLIVDPGPMRQRTVLTALLVDAGRWVTAETLIDRVWGEDVPARARASLYTYISRLRRILTEPGAPLSASARLPDGAVLARSGRSGYLLDVPPSWVDVHVFRNLVDQAGRARLTDGERADRLREAIGLWRGEPLSGLSGAWAERTRRTWEHQRVEAVLSWAEVELRRGCAASVVGTLDALVAEHPLVEPLTVMLMRALYVTGRRSESLSCYAALRERLAEELGTDPSTEAERVHQAILRGQPVKAAAPVQSAAHSAPSANRQAERVVPAQLPLNIRGFIGRQQELNALDAALDSALEDQAQVAAVSGTAGVGKTALATHWAHRVAARFPGGQLYVNLRGFGPAGTAVTADEALRGFLEALAVPAVRIPAELERRAALYRSLLAGRRVLVMLDNARDADQVRPLLPSSSGSFAVITSRDRLTGLVAAEDAHLHVLSLLSRTEAQRLLARRLGKERVSAEPQAVEEIISCCAGLPLALAIASARAASQPGFPLSAVAGELRVSQGSLDAFDGGDLSTDARAIFSWSYQALSARAARLFRLLGLHTGTEFSALATAALAGVDLRTAQLSLAELTRAHLLVEDAPGRYGLHDLLRAYATERLLAEEPAVERDRAVERLLMWYLHTADAASPYFTPGRQRFRVEPIAAGCRPLAFDTYEQALSWSECERRNLVAAVPQAVAVGRPDLAWRLSATLWGFFYLRSYLHDWLDTAQCALNAVRLTGDREGQARSLGDVACALTQMRRYEEAVEHLREAMALSRTLGDMHSLAQIMANLGYVYRHIGPLGRSVEYCRRSLAVYRVHGEGWGREGNVWANLGDSYERLGRFNEARACLKRALPLLRSEGDRWGEGFLFEVLGTVHRRLRQHEDAVASYRQAIKTYADTGNRWGQANTLSILGTAYLENGEAARARQTWQQAVDILVDLGHPDADDVRSRLRSLQ